MATLLWANIASAIPPLDSIKLTACKLPDLALAARCGVLAKVLEDGPNPPKDVARAATLYQSACDGGIVAACSNLGALYGDTPADAFVVNVGSPVNTPATIAAGELNAQASVRMSPFAQYVQILLTAVPTTQSLP